jgi:MFS family permease
VMAAAPTIAVAIIGSAVGGVGNGVEAVSARTALQEEVEAQWMALIMSLNESMFQVMPGAGIVIGGAVTSLAGPRAALTIGGFGSLVITALAWIVLRPGSVVGRAGDEPPLGDGTRPRAKPASATRHR